MKRLLYFDPSSTSGPPLGPKTKPATVRSSLFRKFFPKYLNNLSFLAKGGPIISKLKRTKIIRDPTGSPFADQRRREWRLIIANKAKSVKTLSAYPEFTNQFAEKIKFLSYLKSIHIYLPFDSLSFAANNQTVDYFYMLKACQKMHRLPYLKNLEFTQLTKSSKALFQQLDASPRLLKVLKNLSLQSKWRGGQDTEMMEILKNSKNLLKYVTALKLGMLSSPSHYVNFQALADSCPHLSSLYFEFCCPNNSDSVEINYLGAVKTFQNLKSLDLLIGDTFTFLRDFTLPPLIEKLLLKFEQDLSMETLCKINHIFTDHMEGNPTLERFYKEFQDVQNLQALTILFRSDMTQEDYKYQNLLSQGILKRTTSPLKQLTFRGVTPRFSPKKESQAFLNDSYLPQFLQSFSHLGETIKALDIGNERSIISEFDLSLLRNKFTKLSTITITGILDGLNILLFLKQIISLGNSITTIKLNISVDCTAKPLITILEQLNQLQKPEKLGLKLQIKFFENMNFETLKSDSNSFNKEFKENLEKSPKLQGVSLKLYVDKVVLKYFRGFLGVYGTKFDDLAIITDSLGFSYE